VVGITQSGAATDGYLSSSVDWNTFNNKVAGSGTANTLPMWGSSSSLVNSPLSYAADTFNFQYNSATGGAVVFTNSNGAAYAYTIQMNNFGSPRSTVHSYTDGLIIQSIGGHSGVKNVCQWQPMILGGGTFDNGYKLEITGDLYVNTIVNAVTDTDKFLVSDGGVIKYRTGAEVLSDIGAQGALTLTTTGTTGAATLIGDVLNIPNYSTDLTGYVPYTGATTNVNLGIYSLTASSFTASSSIINSTASGPTGFTNSSVLYSVAGFGNLFGVDGSFSTKYFGLKTDGTFVHIGGNASFGGNLTASSLIKSGGTSSQFLKADGSVDSTTYQNTADKGQPNGYASLDGNGKVPLVQINDALIGNVNFQGLWNASTNTPTLVDPPSSGTKGYYYIVSTGGTFAGITFEVGDWIISNGTAWGKVDNTDAVSSVFGRTGNVTASNGDYNTSQVTESGNLYYTDARSRAALSFVAGSGAYNSGTGVITIPTNNNQITNGAGYITSAALAGYLPLTGGTLTGDLNGTSASFSGSLT
jgi:hypothetical protein